MAPEGPRVLAFPNSQETPNEFWRSRLQTRSLPSFGMCASRILKVPFLWKLTESEVICRWRSSSSFGGVPSCGRSKGPELGLLENVPLSLKRPPLVFFMIPQNPPESPLLISAQQQKQHMRVFWPNKHISLAQHPSHMKRLNHLSHLFIQFNHLSMSESRSTLRAPPRTVNSSMCFDRCCLNWGLDFHQSKRSNSG